MVRSTLINAISKNRHEIPRKKIIEAVDTIIESMTNALAINDRIEIRGFGSFTLSYREAKTGRNPKTGGLVRISDKYIPRFKPGKALRERVNC